MGAAHPFAGLRTRAKSGSSIKNALLRRNISRENHTTAQYRLIAWTIGFYDGQVLDPGNARFAPEKKSMRRLLLSTVALVGFTSAALAGDLASTNDAPVSDAPASTHSWTGFYLGGQVGETRNNERVDESADPNAPQSLGSLPPRGGANSAPY